MQGGAIILAAGVSRRFGSDKRQFKLADGTPMLLATLTRYMEVFDDLRVVLREDDTALHEQLIEAQPAIRITVSLDARLGMGHSLASGIGAVAAWDYAFIGLGDMPFVRAETLQSLLDNFLQLPQPAILQPVHSGRAGHPVGFHNTFFPELRSLRGDTGARNLLHNHEDSVTRLACDDAGVLQDLDTPV